MGHLHSRPASASLKRTNSNWKEAWLPARKQDATASIDYRSGPSKVIEIPPDNIFVPIQEDNILPQIPIGQHHPVTRKGIVDADTKPVHTNKFYANGFLGAQNQPIWAHPYSIWWGKGVEEPNGLKTVGMCVCHVEESDLEYGPGDPASAYINPRKQCLILSARELDQQTFLTTDTHLPFSVNINLSIPSTQEPMMTFPIVQGMSFVTAGYRNAMPTVQTGGKGFMEFSGPVKIGNSVKHRVRDMDGRDWLIYINPVQGVTYDATKFFKIDANTIIGPPFFKGTIQVCKNPLGSETEALYDRACGTFVIEAKLTATVNDTRGTYTFHYTKIGTSPLLMFALPHHIQSLDPALTNQITKLHLRTTTKGTATALWTDQLTLTEPALPTSMSFAPWLPSTPPAHKIRYPPEVLSFIAAVAERDLRRSMTDPIPQDSIYYAGKSLAKFATIVWVVSDVLSNPTLAAAGLGKLKIEIGRYVSNQQLHPVYYDASWGGLVSSAGFADAGADFGNTYYNDHHFHYGYFVYVAAVIASLEPEWLSADGGVNRAWTNMLVKDFAESAYDGRDFVWQRCFDWWHGHSWAKGLWSSGDGKDQESSSEDGFAAWAMKMWGKVSGDAAMEKRGNLILAVQARSFNHYFYLASNNPIHPPRFTPNKVAGILFENKVHYTTYFGSSAPLVHGIHMLPVYPPSALLRARTWVKEEWAAFFSGGRADVEDGWRGVLHANLALGDARASYAFFRDGVDGHWDERWIDGGASRAWYLVWAAGLSELGRR
ncbi:endo-1,3(4)-beta-glucanase 1 precursor [Ampelomyces quisqualis]|uniref:glucan endo-1,3-beta-D-glucosidase n=1 Tax=Ampelomyces quisqualis TaxID=50730 RepID=A0A6A5Q977_AMPQU|nr:endo-1,3(4)-beta-glucanase 1 precursor [Ampelomyces quisqualis]